MSLEENKPAMYADLSGRTVMVVGTNTGIGLEAAKHFAKMGPKRLICTCRTEEKCSQVENVIRKETGYTNVEGWVLELSDFSSIKAFVDKFEKDGDDLHLLVENAGVIRFDYTRTKDGLETAVQVNHVAGALLAVLLIPSLLKTAQKNGTVSRVVFVSSGGHFKAGIPGHNFERNVKILEMLSSPEFCAGENVMMQRYFDSKFLNVLFARALQAHIPSSLPLVVSDVCPGFCLSELRRHIDVGQFVEREKTARTSEEGSRQLLYAALGPDPQKLDSQDVTNVMRGAYIANVSIVDPHPIVKTEAGVELQQRIWDETWEMMSKVDPRVAAVTTIFKD